MSPFGASLTNKVLVVPGGDHESGLRRRARRYRALARSVSTSLTICKVTTVRVREMSRKRLPPFSPDLRGLNCDQHPGAKRADVWRRCRKERSERSAVYPDVVGQTYCGPRPRIGLIVTALYCLEIGRQATAYNRDEPQWRQYSIPCKTCQPPLFVA